MRVGADQIAGRHGSPPRKVASVETAAICPARDNGNCIIPPNRYRLRIYTRTCTIKMRSHFKFSLPGSFNMHELSSFASPVPRGAASFRAPHIGLL